MASFTREDKRTHSCGVFTSADIGKKVFTERHDEFLPKMQWINDFVRSKGFDEVVFRDTGDYDVSSADYDYYYELKTPEQLIEEEAARKKVRYTGDSSLHYSF